MKSLMLTTLWKCIGLSIVQIENIKIKNIYKASKVIWKITANVLITCHCILVLCFETIVTKVVFEWMPSCVTSVKSETFCTERFEKCATN